MGSSQLPASPTASQAEATLARAASLQQRHLEAVQRECKDILACSQADEAEEEHQELERGQDECQQQPSGWGSGAADGGQPPAMSPLPFSLSPALHRLAAASGPLHAEAAAQAPAVGGDIEDLGGWAEEQEEDDAVYLQALQAFEAQQAQLQAAQQGEAQQPANAQQPTAQQAQAQQAPHMQQQQQAQQGSGRDIPQVDGAADLGESSGISSGDDAGSQVRKQGVAARAWLVEKCVLTCR